MSSSEELRRIELALMLRRCYESWNSIKQCFIHLREKVDMEMVHELNAVEPRRMIEGFLLDFSPRLTDLYNQFFISIPRSGEEFSDYFNRIKPILDDYVKLSDEFNANRIIND